MRQRKQQKDPGCRLELAPPFFEGKERDSDTTSTPSKDSKKIEISKKTLLNKLDENSASTPPIDMDLGDPRAIMPLRPDRSDGGDDNDDEHSIERLGATHIRGMGRGGEGSSTADLTIVYSMGPSSDASQGVHQVPSSRNDNNEKLLTAELAPEPPEIVAGTPMENHKTRNILVLLSLVVVAVGVAIIVTWQVLSTRAGGDDYNSLQSTSGFTLQPTQKPSLVPTSAPTISGSPTTAPTKILLPQAIDMFSLYIPDIPNGSPNQQRALDWLVEDGVAEELITAGSAGHLLDRYVLALLYYAASEEDWKNSTGWILTDSVCNWHGTICRTGGRVDDIFLCKCDSKQKRSFVIKQQIVMFIVLSLTKSCFYI